MKVSDFVVLKADRPNRDLIDLKIREMLEDYTKKVVQALKEKLYEIGYLFESEMERAIFIDDRIRLIYTTGNPHIINVCRDYIDENNLGAILFQFSNAITFGMGGDDFVNNNYTISIG